jgi:hypothetical protein
MVTFIHAALLVNVGKNAAAFIIALDGGCTSEVFFF